MCQWEHPLDAEYKALAERARKQQTSGAGNDLSEDASQIDSGIRSLQTDDSDLGTDVSPQSATGATVVGVIRKMESSLQNTGRFLAPLVSTRHKRFEVTSHTTNSPLPRAPLASIALSAKAEDRVVSAPRGDEGASVRGFTLSGRGAMFLKSNAKKPDSGRIDPFTADAEARGSGDGRNVKSILRDSSLTDVRKRFEGKPAEQDADDRKSVRFNLDALERGGDAMYNEAPTSDESSGSEENVDVWDEEKFVKEVKVTASKPPDAKAAAELSDSHKSSSNSGNSPTTMFDRKIDSAGAIKPLYEDTDSDSVASVKSFNRKLSEMAPFKAAPHPSDANELRSSQAKRLEGLGKSLDEELAAERSKLREKMDKSLAELKTELLERNSREIDEFEKHIKSESSVDLERDVRAEEDKLQAEFEKRCAEAREQHKRRIDELKRELEEEAKDRKIEIESQHNMAVENFKRQLREELEEVRKRLVAEHRAGEEQLQKGHKVMLEELVRDLKSEEELIRKEHARKLEEVRDKLSHELELDRQRMRESGENHLYEKVRCEKRLLEDKYRCLKDKYARLKADVKLSLERRNQRREQQSVTTGSETERSNSNRNAGLPSDAHGSKQDIGRPPQLLAQRNHFELSRNRSSERPESGEHPSKRFGAAAKYLSHIQQQQHPHDDATSVSQSDTTISNNYRRPDRLSAPQQAENGNSDSEAYPSEAAAPAQENNNNVRDGHVRQRKKQFTRTKSASTSRLNSGEQRNGDVQPRPCTPVESLRRQLQKLEDLEDQFPENSLETTYHLRYPFTAESGKRHAGSSSELEFFKHRIHLERDSVRRAKESLRSQRTDFRTRQRDIKHRHKSAKRHTIDQMIQEEKELTEMEVNLHRTRALLGEKVIRLRHLEQSLQRLYESDKTLLLLDGQPPFDEKFSNRDDATISDLSSHSSSGFSSTDFASDTHHQSKRNDICQESGEIIQSLENLNAEIREIWNILSKQQTHGGPFHCLFLSLFTELRPSCRTDSAADVPVQGPELAGDAEQLRGGDAAAVCEHPLHPDAGRPPGDLPADDRRRRGRWPGGRSVAAAAPDQRGPHDRLAVAAGQLHHQPRRAHPRPAELAEAGQGGARAAQRRPANRPLISPTDGQPGNVPKCD